MRAAFALLLALLPANEQLMRILSFGHGLVAPADLHVILIVERDARNRSLTLEVDGEAFYRSGAYDLDETSKRAWDEWWPALPCGHYQFRAALRRVEADGKTRFERAARPFEVRCAQCDEEPEAER